MTNLKTGQKDYFNLTNYATSVFELYYYEMKDKFSDYPVCLIEYFEQENHERLIEIQFENEQVVLSCIYDEELKCDTACL